MNLQAFAYDSPDVTVSGPRGFKDLLAISIWAVVMVMLAFLIFDLQHPVYEFFFALFGISVFICLRVFFDNLWKRIWYY
jgi:hypothetical protein